jgi:hypothetical protein
MTRFFISLLLLVFVTAGCGGSSRPPGLPKLTPCEFTIQFEDGMPVVEASVMMWPADGKWSANGSTDSSGFVKIATQGTYSGVAPGEFSITVTKQETIFPPGYDPDKEGGPDPIVKNLIHPDFFVPNQTPLKITVTTTPIKETLQVKKPK